MEKIKDFLILKNGSGNGSGDGYGDGSGNGSGDGDGDGSGYGDGYGYGSGDGDGSGNGSGDGDGDGSGYGDGYGDGIKSINNIIIFYVDDISTIITKVKGNIAKGFILNSDFTLSPCYVVKNDDYFAHGETLHKAQEALQEKVFQGMSQEERIEEFINSHNFHQAYSNASFFSWHNKLTGSCLMGREQFAKEHDIDVENGEMTTKEFLELTKNDYGSDVIKQVINEYS